MKATRHRWFDGDSNKVYDDPVPIRLPGYYSDTYTADEIRELNLLAKHPVVCPLPDLD